MKKIFYGSTILFGILLIGSFSIQESFAISINPCSTPKAQPIVVDSERNLVYHFGTNLSGHSGEYGFPDFVGILSVSDGITNKKIMDLSKDYTIFDMVLDQEKNQIFLSVSGSKSIIILDASTGEKLNDLALGYDPGGLFYNQNSNTLYVTNPKSDFISVLNFDKNDEKEIQVGNSPYKMTFNDSANLLYVTNIGSSSISVIDIITNKLQNSIELENAPYEIIVNTLEDIIYVANSGTRKNPGNSITVIDGLTNSVQSAITLDFVPYDIDVNPTFGKLYVASCFGSISIIDENTLKIVDKIDIPHATVSGLGLNEKTNLMYAVGYSPGLIGTIFTGNGTFQSQILQQDLTDIIWYGPSGEKSNIHKDLVWVNKGLWQFLSNDYVDYLERFYDFEVEKRDGKIQNLGESKLVVITGQKSISTAESIELKKFVKTGGQLILAPGYMQGCEIVPLCLMEFSTNFGFGFEQYPSIRILPDQKYIEHLIWGKPNSYPSYGEVTSDPYVKYIFDEENVKVLARAKSTSYRPHLGPISDQPAIVLNENPSFNGGKVLGLGYELFIERLNARVFFENIINFMLTDIPDRSKLLSSSDIISDKHLEYGSQYYKIKSPMLYAPQYETQDYTLSCFANDKILDGSIKSISNVRLNSSEKTDANSWKFNVKRDSDKDKENRYKGRYNAFVICEYELSQESLIKENNKDRICNEEMQLIFKSTDGSPACVKPETAEKLIERGWANR